MAKARKIIAGAAAAAATTGLVVAARKMRKTEHVYHVGADEAGWYVKAEGADRATSRHDTKKSAVAAGREIARARIPARLIIHKRDGEVQAEHEYREN